jgi:hypothetical protein
MHRGDTPLVSRVESTETRAPAADGRKERQLIAGRYRLASFHRGDETTEVWRALDESTTQVVSLEFLRDPDPASKEPFLAGARRLAAVAQPSVMRVAAIHDDADATFIVFEHLVHIPVPLEWLKPAVETPAPLLTMAEPTAVETPAVAPAAAEPAVATADATAVAGGDHGLSLLLFALRSRELSLIDQALLQESTIELLDVVLAELKAVRLDPDLLPDARAFVGSLLTSGPRRAASAIGGLATIRPRVRVATPRMSRPKQPKQPKQPKLDSVPRLNETPVAAAKPVKAPKLKAPRAPRAERMPGRGVRWGRVLSRGLVLGVLAAVLSSLPPALIGNLGNVASDVAVVAGNVAGQVSSTISEKLAAVAPSLSGLQRAGFELPPLGAYSAAFEAQSPYPSANPNGTVEWVVALRNTGSVGWYRGIDGAQASLAFADGTMAGVQTTAYVGPGQVGWFVVHFSAPSQVGTSKVSLLPRIDGRGSMPDLGIYASVTVSPNP